MSTSLWPNSGRQQFKKSASVQFAPGAKVQFFSATGTAPLTVYQNADATNAHNTASLVTDSYSLWPEIHVPYGTYNYRILDSDDTIISTIEEVLNPNPNQDASGTDPVTEIVTGMTMWIPAKTTWSGFVRMNGRSIGPVGSGATERANADCEDLFLWLWNNLADAQAAVSTGRGGTAAADWAAGTKTISIPNMQAGLPWGLDDMGGSAAGGFASTTFSNGDATTGGSFIALNTTTLVEANLPAHTHGAGTYAISTDGSHTHSNTLSDPGHLHTTTQYRTGVNTVGGGATSVPNISSGDTAGPNTGSTTTGVSINNVSAGSHNHSLSGASASTGSGTALDTTSRGILGTWFQKL